MPTSPTEQYLLELINDARLDPIGNAARYISAYTPLLTSPASNIQTALNQFRVDGTAVLAAFQALPAAQPLAYNEVLAGGAWAHNALMIAADVQSHQVTRLGEPSLGPRLSAEGYPYLYGGENIYAYSYDMLYAQAAFMVDWGGSAATGGMQSPAGHRINQMNPAYREVGIAVTEDDDVATAVGPNVITEDFGTRGNAGIFLLGVTYADTDRDGFYSPGEGLDGLNVTVRDTSTSTGASGGYTLQSSLTGSQTVQLSGGGLPGTVSVGMSFTNGLNAKLDVVNGDTLLTSVSGQVSGAVRTIQALGVQPLRISLGDDTGRTLRANAGGNTLLGGAGDDVLMGGAGDDTLDGGAGINVMDGAGGNNTASFAFSTTGATITRAGDAWTILSGTTHDVVSNVQRYRFTDGTFTDLSELSTHDVRFTSPAAATTGSSTSEAYAGPVAYLRHQYIWSSADDVAISAAQPDTFLKGGGGRDALLVSGGRNVLDGGAGSNFLIGGTGADGGTDTFFVDARGPAVTWSTIVNFHPGDQATIFGFRAGLSTRPTTEAEGATGYTGLTIHSEIDGPGTGILGSMTFAGIDRATADAHFQFTTGTLPGDIDYLLIQYV